MESFLKEHQSKIEMNEKTLHDLNAEFEHLIADFTEEQKKYYQEMCNTVIENLKTARMAIAQYHECINDAEENIKKSKRKQNKKKEQNVLQE